MCKHVAAALYGVGARLDEKPELLFVLRNVGQKELLAGAGRDLAFARAKPGAKVIDDGDVAALFGLEMVEPAAETSVSVESCKDHRLNRPVQRRRLHHRGEGPAPPGALRSCCGAKKENATNFGGRHIPPVVIVNYDRGRVDATRCCDGFCHDGVATADDRFAADAVVVRIGEVGPQLWLL